MSEILSENTKIFVRYVYDGPVDEEDDGFVVYWLAADYVGEIRKKGRAYDKRDWNTLGGEEVDLDQVFDFLGEYGDQDKAIAMAKRLGKIVECGKGLIANGWIMEVVLSYEVMTRKITCIEPANPLVVLALQAE